MVIKNQKVANLHEKKIKHNKIIEDERRRIEARFGILSNIFSIVGTEYRRSLRDFDIYLKTSCALLNLNNYLITDDDNNDALLSPMMNYEESRPVENLGEEIDYLETINLVNNSINDDDDDDLENVYNYLFIFYNSF